MKAGAQSIREVLGRPPVHPFPARMAPGLALEALCDLRKGATVLDPMVGSGTVLALARARGYRAVGFDLDPLAVLISRVWTGTLDENAVRTEAEQVVAEARWMLAKNDDKPAYPEAADDSTRAFIHYWFDETNKHQLTALAAAITSRPKGGVRDALWCAFSRQIIAKQAGVSLALDLSHSRPHKTYQIAPRRALDGYRDAVELVIRGCLTHSSRDRGPVSSVRRGDARHLPLADDAVDLVFTSPPYLNAIDYLRCSKFSLVWMGFSVLQLRSLRSGSIGAEVGVSRNELHDEMLAYLKLRPQLPPRMTAILCRYITDTHQAMSEISRVLRDGGRAMVVVGENTIRGTFIPTGRLIARLGMKAGLTLSGESTRALPGNRRYLPPPSSGDSALSGRMRREVVLTFERRRVWSRKSARPPA